MATVHYASLTRISDLPLRQWSLAPLPQHQWEDGDYVVGEVVARPGALSSVELCDGRVVEVRPGDLVVGAFGRRAATLGACGDPWAVEDDLVMHALTVAGLFGRVTSNWGPHPMELTYRGHVLAGSKPIRMSDYALPAVPRVFHHPVVLLIGSSMSAGKTTAAKAIIRMLVGRGLTVIGTKLTGAGRYKDALAMADAGADRVLDFVDAGLPSTVCDESVYRDALSALLSTIAGDEADVVVAEAGASPLEPYNGHIAIEAIKENVAFTVLSASDPYAVVGVTTAYHTEPDVITGIAANTEAGAALVRKLSGLSVVNIRDPMGLHMLEELLVNALHLSDEVLEVT